MIKFWLLFSTFFLIGLFTFGGGYAMIPLITESVIKQGWMESLDQVYQFIGIAEATPGPFAVNIATFIGFNQNGFFGALCSTIGVILPSFIIILIIAKFGDKILKTKVMKNALNGIRYVVVALVASVTIKILFKNIFLVELDFLNFSIKKFDWVMFIITLVMLIFNFIPFSKNGKKIKLSPIITIVLSGILGMLLYLL